MRNLPLGDAVKNSAGGLLPSPGHFFWLGDSNKRLAWVYCSGVSRDSSDSVEVGLGVSNAAAKGSLPLAKDKLSFWCWRNTLSNKQCSL